MNYKYRQAANEGFPAHLMVLIENNYADERRHLSFIERRLDAARARLGIGKTIGIGALGVVAGVALWIQIASR